MRILVGVIWVALSGAAFIMVDAQAQGKDVNAQFTLQSPGWSNDLENPDSREYKNLESNVTNKVMADLGTSLASSCTVLSFRDDGADFVIVDLSVSTTIMGKKKANKRVRNALKKMTTYLYPSTVSTGVRLCVPVEDGCVKYNNDLATHDLFTICIPARDRIDCLEKLSNEEVDLARGDAADVCYAYKKYGNDTSVVAETRDKDKKDDIYRYRAVAVVRRSTINGLNALKGSRSCNTGYGKTSGWRVPISKLVEDGQISLNCSGNVTEVEKILHSVSSYFGQACIPGKWAPDAATDKRLKAKYWNLCSLCDDPIACSSNDAYAGYDGALKCLTNETADVAWTKLDAVHKFFNDISNNVNKADFGLLLYNGTIVDIDYSVSDDGPSPGWAGRPWPVWLTWRSHSKQGFGLVRNIKAVMGVADSCTTTKNWAKDVLGITKCSVIEKLKRRTPKNYLKKAGYYTVCTFEGCDPTPVRLCVDAKAEEKCLQLSYALKSHQVRPYLTCVVQENEKKCVDAIIDGTADIVTLDGGDMFKAYNRDNTIIPVISEVYEGTNVSYYAVAVVNAGSTINSLDDLQGKKSCHTGIGKSAGWNVPVITLIEKGLLDKNNSDYAKQIGNFFIKSCAPGAKNNTDYDPDGTNPESLCSLCVGNGDGQHVCERNSDENYYGYSGAFRCLVEGAGDVAFIKQTTVLGNTGYDDEDENTNLWNENLNETDYQLLCRNGGRKDVSEFESCNWASVPSHKVVARNDNGVLQEEIRMLLLQAAKTFPLGQDGFALFGDYDGVRDIIFKSSAITLENFSEDEFIELLEGTYYKAVTDL